MTQTQDPATAFAMHNHQSCCGDVLAQVDQIVQKSGLRFTPVRRRTLEILLEQHRALGAYEVLDRLAADGFGKQPPVAYRALEFLVENGMAHRIGRLNAFAACMSPGKAHAPLFFICTACDAIAEAPEESVALAVSDAAERLGFQIERVNIETFGICPACQDGNGL